MVLVHGTRTVTGVLVPWQTLAEPRKSLECWSVLRASRRVRRQGTDDVVLSRACLQPDMCMLAATAGSGLTQLLGERVLLGGNMGARAVFSLREQ